MTECKINAPFIHVFSIMQEADLYSGWMPNMPYCDTVKFVSNYRQLVKTVIDFPWPFTSRESYVRASAFFDQEQGGLLDVVRSYNSKNYFGYEIPDETSEMVRMNIKRGFHWIKYVDPDNCISTGTFLVDAKISLIPDWLINYLMKS